MLKNQPYPPTIDKIIQPPLNSFKLTYTRQQPAVYDSSINADRFVGSEISKENLFLLNHFYLTYFTYIPIL